MKLICYGDSNTYGFDPRGPIPGRYDEGHRWCDLLEQNTGWTVINEGENGRIVPEPSWGYSSLRRVLSESAPADLFCIMLGTNDILISSRMDVTPVVARMKALLEVLQAEWPAMHLVLITPPPIDIPEFPEAGDKLARLIEAYRVLALEYNIPMISNHSWKIPLAFDGAHFSEDGHHVFAACLERELRDLFPDLISI